MQAPHNLFAGQVVADVILILVPLQGNVADAVPRGIILREATGIRFAPPCAGLAPGGCPKQPKT